MKILLVGDSWGCGIWPARSNDYRVVHKGLELYLSEKHNVTNMSVPAGCNFTAHDNILKNYSNYDYVVWIVTEPDRSFQKFNEYFKEPKLHDHYDNEYDIYTNSIRSHKKIINSIKKACGSKTILIGGLHKLDRSDLYNGFFFTANWLDILQPNDLKTYYVGHHRDIAPESEISACRNYQNYLMKNKKHFFPDGIHPNELSHKILCNKIEEVINGS